MYTMVPFKILWIQPQCLWYCNVSMDVKITISSRLVSGDRPIHINGIWWAPLLCLQLTSHTCWTSPCTRCFVWARCVCLEDECVCCNGLGPGSTTALLLQTQLHVYTHTNKYRHRHSYQANTYTWGAKMDSPSFSLSHTQTQSNKHSQIMWSSDCSWRECFSGYLSSSLDVPNVALNPFHYLWGEISQSFSRIPGQTVFWCCMCVSMCICVSMQILDVRHTLILSWQPLCLVVPPGCVCVSAWWSPSSCDYYVSQVHSQGN